MILLSDNNPSISGDPAESALDCISSPVAIPESVILSIDISVIASVRREQIDASFSQTLAGQIAIVDRVFDYSLRLCSWPYGSSFGDTDFQE
jgi:hypothetical protein